MSTATTTESATSELQLATFYVGELLLGVDLNAVQEINRHVNVTPVPGSPEVVRGVINLRGDVATVIDLRCLLGMGEAEMTRDSRNLITRSQDEMIGLWVDRISDIVSIGIHEMDPPPGNVAGVDGRFFRGVYTTEDKIIVILDLEETLANI
jgi:purine-binding chemotaxis protein CheW